MAGISRFARLWLLDSNALTCCQTYALVGDVINTTYRLNDTKVTASVGRTTICNVSNNKMTCQRVSFDSQSTLQHRKAALLTTY